MQLSTQHNDIKDLNKIDWEIIFSKYWFDKPPEFVDRTRRRMAELLVYQHVPITCILEVVVMNKKMKTIVEKMVYDQGLLVQVKENLNWYF